MTFSLDQYFTPPKLAVQILEECSLDVTPSGCVDPTCGAGDFLEATQNVFGSERCIGLDRHSPTIRELRRRRPTWILSTADLMRPESYRQSRAFKNAPRADFAVFNPPFSQGATKSVTAHFYGEEISASVAMAYLLRGLEAFAPRLGGAAIVPESLLFSDTDLLARNALRERYSIRELVELGGTTFRGTRARSVAIQLVPGGSKPVVAVSPSSPAKICIRLVRGSLPVHQMKPAKNHGVPYVHTTDLKLLMAGSSVERRTHQRMGGRVRGWVVLLPRVGVPRLEETKAKFLRSEVQLSDCVIALQASSKRAADFAQTLLARRWLDLVSLYRGTGARYVSVKRLTEWLVAAGVEVRRSKA